MPMERIADIIRRLFPHARISMATGVDPLGYRREQLDISAARRDFGWAPEWNLERGIADYAVLWLQTRTAGPNQEACKANPGIVDLTLVEVAFEAIRRACIIQTAGRQSESYKARRGRRPRKTQSALTICQLSLSATISPARQAVNRTVFGENSPLSMTI